jgi:hypothetical protein
VEEEVDRTLLERQTLPDVVMVVVVVVMVVVVGVLWIKD